MSLGVSSRVMSGDEFAQELQRGPTADLCCVSGAAKGSGPDYPGEILFTQDAAGRSWTRIPAEMIESVEVLGRADVGGESCHQVRLHLRTPPQPEAAVLSRLLAQRESVAGRGGGAPSLGGVGAFRSPNDGVLPLRPVDGALRAGDGVLPLRLIVFANGVTLPLLVDLSPFMGWRVGN